MNLLLPGLYLTLMVALNVQSLKWVRFHFLAALVMGAIISATRSSFGEDYLVYQAFFQGKIPVTNNDYLFLYLSHLLSKIDSSGIAGFWLFSLVTVIGYGRFIYVWVPKERLFGLALFFLIPLFYLNSMNLMRAHFVIAIILFLISIRGFKTFPIIIGATITFFIHKISILTVLVNQASIFNRRFVMSMLPVFVIGVFSFFYWFEDDAVRILGYEYFANHSSNNNLYFIIGFGFVSLVVAFIYANFRLSNTNVVVAANVFIFLFMTLYAFSSLSNFWLRVAQSVFPFILVGIPNIVERVRPRFFGYNIKIIFLCMLIAYLLKSLSII